MILSRGGTTFVLPRIDAHIAKQPQLRQDGSFAEERRRCLISWAIDRAGFQAFNSGR